MTALGVTTFAGRELPPCQGIRRPRSAGRIRRSRHTSMPLVWGVLWVERLGLDKSRTWDAWQAFISCEQSEVRSMAQKILLWSHCPETPAELTARGVSPQALLKCIELCLWDRRLSATEAARLEEAVLANLTPHGQWT